MATVGEQLKHAREAKNIALEQVGEITKIRTDHLRALEESNFEMFTAPVYIRGFVRTYSTLLKLDVRQVMAALDAELGQTKKFAEPPPLTDRPKGIVDWIMLQLSKLDWRVGLVLVGLLLVVGLGFGGYAWWRYQKKADPLAGVKPAMHKPAQRGAGDTLPIPPNQKR